MKKFLAAGAFLLSALLLFLPFPRLLSRAEENYLCRWEDGSVTYESHASALADFSSADEESCTLSRGGKEGKIALGGEYRALFRLLQRGEIAELLRASGVSDPLERALLFNTFGDIGYYSEGLLAWDGERFALARREIFSRIFLTDGTLPADVLARTRATALILGEDAVLTGKALAGSSVREVEARAPHFVSDGAVYLRTAGGIRLSAVLPETVSLAPRCDFFDGGAFAAAERLEHLDLCSVPESRLDRDELLALPALKTLHTTMAYFPAASASLLPCGCYLYLIENI